MGSGGSDIPRLDEIGRTKAIDHTIRNSDGALVGRLRLYENRTQDGAVCTQLELRLENQSDYFVYAESWLDAQGYANRWQRVVVKMEPRQSLTDPVRLSIYIPGETGAASTDVRDDKASPACIVREGKAVCPLRTGCIYSDRCPSGVCYVAAHWPVRELENDGRKSVLESLQAQSLHTQDPGT